MTQHVRVLEYQRDIEQKEEIVNKLIKHFDDCSKDRVDWVDVDYINDASTWFQDDFKQACRVYNVAETVGRCTASNIKALVEKIKFDFPYKFRVEFAEKHNDTLESIIKIVWETSERLIGLSLDADKFPGGIEPHIDCVLVVDEINKYKSAKEENSERIDFLERIFESYEVPLVQKDIIKWKINDYYCLIL